MSPKQTVHLAVSIRQRLRNLAKARGEEFQRVLTRYALERLLYRLSKSPYQDRFLLKGALLFSVWTQKPHRFTKDLDLLGRTEPSVARLEELYRDLCLLPLAPEEEDGLVFLPETVTGAEIREENIYGGIRITLTAMLGTARLPLQIDVGFGDAITPSPQEIEFPVLLSLPAPRLRAYSRETVVAEKLEAMVSLKLDNSRMKDFYDLWELSRRFPFEGEILTQAIAATFARRGTPLPSISNNMPVALTDTFSGDAAKQAQCRHLFTGTG